MTRRRTLCHHTPSVIIDRHKTVSTPTGPQAMILRTVIHGDKTWQVPFYPGGGQAFPTLVENHH